MLCCGGGEEAVAARVFGAIIENMEGTDVGEAMIPTVVYETIAYMRGKGVDSPHAQGIFRKSANAVKLRNCKEMYNQGLKVDFETLGQVSTAANAIKAFFRDLKEPVFPTASYQAIIRMQETEKNNDAKIGKTRQLLETHTPPANLNTLRALLYFIADVGDKSETNGMSTSNLALVWGPNLIWGKGAGPDSGRIPQLAHIKAVSDFLEFVINNREHIFVGLNKEGYVEVDL